MFARFAQIAIASVSLVVGGQTHATPLSYGSYYDETVQAMCANGSCRVEFSQLPANKLLMVSKINCAGFTFEPLIAANLQVSASAGGSPLSRYFYLAVPPAQLINGTYRSNFREDTHYLIGQGRFPYVTLFSTGGAGTFTCTLIGDLVTPIQ